MISETTIFTISSEEEFETTALAVFQFQYKNIKVYKDFCELLKIDPNSIQKLEDIPFLPIQFFKSHKILADNLNYEKVFFSSGTMGIGTSKHFVSNLSLYKKSFTDTFTRYFGDLDQLCILALLPSYLEQENSSLIYMADELIKKTNNPLSGFYLDETDSLIEKLQTLESIGQKTILLGVSYALLDLIELKSFQLKNTTIMETGGMKGKRKEMIKEELHHKLKKGFGVSTIYSEYGMTELLSQAYSKGNGIFTCPSWMKVITRDTEDAQSKVMEQTGGINIIDLCNLYSCSFIATQDLGKIYTDGSFEILGRFDDSDIRGCNLMVF